MNINDAFLRLNNGVKKFGEFNNDCSRLFGLRLHNF